MRLFFISLRVEGIPAKLSRQYETVNNSVFEAQKHPCKCCFFSFKIYLQNKMN